MKYRVAISGPRLLRDLEEAKPLLDATGFEFFPAKNVVQHLNEDQLIELCADLDGIVCGGDRFTARVFDACPKLKAVCKWGTGVDAIDLKAASDRGVLVRNVPDAFSVPVTESVLCFMLMFARRQPMLTDELRAGRWTPVDGFTLAESTLGIVGVGNIGRTLARRASAFGMKLYGHDPRPVPAQFVDDTGIEMTNLDTMLPECDFVSINTDLNPTSRHLVNASFLSKMKPSAYLINTARGPVVDQEALTQALKDKVIAGAGLDVFESEPLGDHALAKMDNVLLSPHLANSGPRACRAVHQRVLDNISELLRRSGRGPGEPRDPEAYAKAVHEGAGGMV